ncbi:hypothetical protein SNE25_05730 [Mucilaginibacter sabulilitoris]|uniref:Uncharacterized protein n=1 Tax=Mucilaginibacter sabulilitoris TaxID=1173583 RepID=A0ABZ0TQ44_9SPHI|nr:hypothetical protein [Mucilaginibacter sabulilitoris]WPU95022.1 hypothetical protein SNE25_05730 [Mucilaginibacter sabulilitoris]
MKKAAIITIAAFYLSLTTGMFVCMVHCAGEHFFQPKMAMQAMNHNSHQDRHCDKNKACDCCSKHGNYVIKENIKPVSVDVQAPQVFLVFQQLNYVPLTDQYSISDRFIGRYAKAPPSPSGKFIAIQLRSLQI